ncbi:MAG TPA: LCP family protein [Acidimicrobiia bacterium]|nr:LCP family protein [Acidimicrobiia bacterium]
MRVLEYIVFHPWRTLTILVAGTLLGMGAFYAQQVSAALGAVAVEDFNLEEARSAIETPNEPNGPPLSTAFDFGEPAYDLDSEMALINARLAGLPDQTTFNVSAFGEPIPDDVFNAYLLVGTDASGFLADTIILALQPSDDSAPIMASLPRDLFVWNLCKQTFTRLNSGLGGCPGEASGLELLAIMVEDYTGIPIDHIARINFAGFARLVDVMGGITVCVDRPTRDAKAHLELQSAGCQVVGGETALAWVRSRQPEQLIGGEWKAVRGSDFTRQRHQQDVLFQLAGKAASFSSPASLVSRLSAISSSVRLDSSWSLSQAVGDAWRYRGIKRDSVDRFSISVSDYRTSYGAQVLLPSRPFRDDLAEVYPLD